MVSPAQPQVKWAYPDEPGGPDVCISYSLFVSPPPTDHFGEADPEVSAMNACMLRVKALTSEVIDSGACILK